MKRFFMVLAAVLILACLAAVSAGCAEDWFAGETETDSTGKWSYQILPDGTAAITGYEFARKLDFPAEVDGVPVTVIQGVKWYSGIEEDRMKVQQVTIPDTVRALGEEVFINMTGLTRVKLPSGLQEIGALAFDNTRLTEITIPEGVAVIPDKAFASCTALKKVSLPSTLRTIGKEAFSGCPLTALKLPDGLEKIGPEAFRYNGLKELEIPESVQEIGYAAFVPGGKAALKKVTFRSASTELGKGILGYDNGFTAYLNSLSPKEKKGTIHYDTGNQENWTDYYAVPSNATVPEITVNCWPGSTADLLYTWNVKKNYLKWDETHILTLPADPVLKIGAVSNEDRIYELIVPEGVEEIPDFALYEFRTLNKISLPSTLKKIGKSSFSFCSALQEITLPKGVGEIGELAFADCISLEKINLPDGITEIPDMAFTDCMKLAKVTWPKAGLVRIGKNAFAYCSGLKDVQFGKRLEEIGEFAFFGSGLQKAALPDTVTKLGTGAFAKSGITALTLPKGLGEIPELLCSGCYSLKTVKIPAGITRIGNRAFLECRSLAGLALPEGLLSIGENAFAQNVDMVLRYKFFKDKATALASLKLPASLQTIGDGAFAACDALTAVTFAKNAALTEIGKEAFGMCLRLKEIRLPDSVQTIGENAFVNCIALKTADLGKGAARAGGGLFKYCSQMTRLTVPASLAEIGPGILEEHGEKLAVICPEGSAMDEYMRQNYPGVTVRRK